MDKRTMIVLLAAILMIGGAAIYLAVASVQKTSLQTAASVAKAQEHTKRSDGRHDLVDVLGFFRGWKANREDRR